MPPLQSSTIWPHSSSTYASSIRLHPYNEPPPLKTAKRILSLKPHRYAPARPSAASTASTPAEIATVPTTSIPSSLLRPCHICHSKPTKRRDLDSYADCGSCGGRTCYICIRQCIMSCGKRRVCSRCCVEQGEEGEVCCWDCLRGMEGEMEMGG